MGSKSYTLKDPNRIKKHKLLRGLRSFVSSLYAVHPTRPVVLTTRRASRIVDKLSLTGKSVALLSFHKSIHSSVVIMSASNTYSYVSVYDGSFCFQDCVDKNSIVEEIADDERHLGAELSDSDVVYIGGLNTVKMMYHIRDRELVNNYSKFSNNCSRSAADILLAGCNIIGPARFQHNRPKWQMPANTAELAKEIDLFLGNRTRR